MNKHIISALVKNHSGVLTRISGLFARRGYNIESLSVCATENPLYSRMTIVALGDDLIIEQITKQLDKLEDVVRVDELLAENSCNRELLLIKINLDSHKRPELESTCNIYKAKTVDLGTDSVVVELTGESSKIDAFVALLAPYGILELVRTGITSISRGRASISDAISMYN